MSYNGPFLRPGEYDPYVGNGSDMGAMQEVVSVAFPTFDYCKHCQSTLPDDVGSHLSDPPSQGKQGPSKPTVSYND